jgi:hypothetical protein
MVSERPGEQVLSLSSLSLYVGPFGEVLKDDSSSQKLISINSFSLSRH